MLGESIFLGLCTIVLVFFTNEIGQRCSDALGKTNDVANQLNFYLFPKKVQRILPLLLLDMQQPVVIKFFGSADCSREQFKKVSNLFSLVNYLFVNTRFLDFRKAINN